MSKMIFANLPVADVEKSVTFYEAGLRKGQALLAARSQCG